MGGKTLCIILIAAAGLLLSCASPASSPGASSHTLSFEVKLEEGEIQVPEGGTKKYDIIFSPESIETGIDCGMPDMCGIDPCTCGSADDWGRCSCNGLEERLPQVSALSGNIDVAAVSVSNGKITVKGIREGTAKIRIDASLIHHGSTSRTITVSVVPVKPAYLIWPGLAVPVTMAVLIALLYIRRKAKKMNCKN